MRGGRHRELEFHANGRLWYATLGRDTVLEGRPYAAGTLVHFDEDGRLVYAAPPLGP